MTDPGASPNPGAGPSTANFKRIPYATDQQGIQGPLFLSVNSIESVVDYLHMDPAMVRDVLLGHLSQYYEVFYIPKRAGGMRLVQAPIGPLKAIQRQLCSALQDIYQKGIITPPAHGFVRNRSIETNARQHLKKHRVLNLDIEAFFPSIGHSQVFRIFKSEPFQFNNGTAEFLTRLCCYANAIAVGAPTSPPLSNLVCVGLDNDLQELAQKHELTFTRYADDITFSSRKKDIPPSLLSQTADGRRRSSGRIVEILQKHGFEINERKVRRQARGQRQEVTGLVVNNKKVAVRRTYIRQLRAMLHCWETHGVAVAAKRYYDQGTVQTRHDGQEQHTFPLVVKGKIGFVGQIMGKEDRAYLVLLHKFKQLAPHLVRGEVPDPGLQAIRHIELHVYTEGKTDRTHLMTALRWHQSKGMFAELNLFFPDVEIDGENELGKYRDRVCREPRTKPKVFVFDRDIPKRVQEHTDKGPFLAYGNGTYSIVIPVPSGRDPQSEICIEHYYSDEEIVTTDHSQRRLFFASEFHPNGAHKVISSVFTKKTDKIKESSSLRPLILDSGVDSGPQSVALSKADFARYISEGTDRYSQFDLSKFGAILDLFVRIAQDWIHAHGPKETV